jgi:ketosteroid isomerase-like protein
MALIACQLGAGGLSEQDQAAIRKLDDDYTKMVTAEKPDVNAAVDLIYAEDAKVLEPNMPACEGRKAIKAASAQMPPLKELKFDIVSLEGRGDLAYEYGAYRLVAVPPGSPAPVTDKGKYVCVWKKQPDGKWKIIQDIWNSDSPVPGLVVPAGALKADATAELKQLGSLVGRWKIEGDAKAGGLGPAGKINVTMNCQWFPGGGQVVCGSEGTGPAGPYQELTVYGYNAETKAYTAFDMDNTGFAATAKGSFQGGNWIYMFDIKVEGKRLKVRSTLSDTSVPSCTWKGEFSMAGGPWTLAGEGKATKVQ